MRPNGKQMFKRMVDSMMVLELTITRTGDPMKKTYKCRRTLGAIVVFSCSHMQTTIITTWKCKDIVKFTQQQGHT